MAEHYAADLILTEVQRHSSGVLLTDVKESVGVGQEDFETAVSELLHEGSLTHAPSAGGTFLRYIPEEERGAPPAPEAGATAAPEAASPSPAPPAAAAAAPPAGTAAAAVPAVVAALLTEAAQEGAQLQIHARVRYTVGQDGALVVSEVLETYGVDLVKPAR